MWQELTAGSNGQKYSNDEIEKIKKTNESLHEENEQLRLHIASLTDGRQALLQKIQEQEKSKQAVQKELVKTQNNMKFEIKAREGLSKKTNMYEYEALNLRDECKNQREELGILRYRVKELEYRLNQERSKRLRDMHEADILRRRNVELESNGSYAEKDALKARQDLNDKLEKMEQVMSQNESQKRVIESMSGEILALNSEITSLKQEMRRATEGRYKLDSSLSLHLREKEGLEREVWKLRKQLVHGGTGSALGTAFPNESRQFGTAGMGGLDSLPHEASEASPFYSSDWKDQSLYGGSSYGGTGPGTGVMPVTRDVKLRSGSAEGVVSYNSTPFRQGYNQIGMRSGTYYFGVCVARIARV